MTRHLRFLFVAMLTIACSLVGKAAEGDTYKLVTDASELKSGDIVVIASGTNAMGAVNTEGTKIDPFRLLSLTVSRNGLTELKKQHWKALKINGILSIPESI